MILRIIGGWNRGHFVQHGNWGHPSKRETPFAFGFSVNNSAFISYYQGYSSPSGMTVTLQSTTVLIPSSLTLLRSQNMPRWPAGNVYELSFESRQRNLQLHMRAEALNCNIPPIIRASWYHNSLISKNIVLCGWWGGFHKGNTAFQAPSRKMFIPKYIFISF